MKKREMNEDRELCLQVLHQNFKNRNVLKKNNYSYELTRPSTNLTLTSVSDAIMGDETAHKRRDARYLLNQEDMVVL